MKEQPLISIIMPAYNSELFIKEAIASVQMQTYPNWELIVVDDGSADSTAKIVLKSQTADARIDYHFQTNQGLGSARNKGIGLAKGDWITFLDSDDQWLENKLERQLEVLKKGRAGVIFSNGFYLDNQNMRLKPYNSPEGFYSAEQLYPELIRHNSISVLSVCFSKDLVEKVGLLDTNKLAYGCQDWDWWLRACKMKANFYGIKERLFKYRLHGHNMSADQVKMKVAVAYVTLKNYEGRNLTRTRRQEIKKQLLSTAWLMIKNSKKLNYAPPYQFLKLLVRILLLAGAAFPALIYGKKFARRIQ